jgi:hypothetical protein
MKTVPLILGILLVLMGGIWILQGINVLPGSFMTGEIRWAIYGGLAAVAGLALVALAGRRKKGSPPPARPPETGSGPA